MAFPQHNLTPQNLARVEQDVGVHLAGWLGAANSDIELHHQHSSMLSFVQRRHAIVQQALNITNEALQALQNDPDPKTMAVRAG